MDADTMDATIGLILKRNKEPILVVALNKAGTISRFCGKFHAWNLPDGDLWLKNEGKLTKPIYSFNVISVTEITEAELIDNLNVLFDIIEMANQTKC